MECEGITQKGVPLGQLLEYLSFARVFSLEVHYVRTDRFLRIVHALLAQDRSHAQNGACSCSVRQNGGVTGAMVTQA